jgi:hypothetical protein
MHYAPIGKNHNVTPTLFPHTTQLFPLASPKAFRSTPCEYNPWDRTFGVEVELYLVAADGSYQLTFGWSPDRLDTARGIAHQDIGLIRYCVLGTTAPFILVVSNP